MSAVCLKPLVNLENEALHFNSCFLLSKKFPSSEFPCETVNDLIGCNRERAETDIMSVNNCLPLMDSVASFLIVFPIFP